MYCKGKWCTAGGKDPLFGRVDGFQIDPKIFLKILIGVQYESCGMLISAVHHEEGEEKLHLLMVDDHIPAGAKMY